MDIENLYQKAVKASDTGNSSYAIEILQQVILFQPDHAKARRKLHTTALKRLGSQKPSKASALMRGGIHYLMALIFKLLKKPEKSVARIEKYLLNDPSNINALLLLAESCALANYSESAIDTFEYVLELAPKNPRALKSLGNIYTDMKNIQRAIECFELLLKVSPTDADAGKRLRDLSALEMMDKERFSKDGDFRRSLKDDKEAEALQLSEKYLRTQDDVDHALAFALEELENDPGEIRHLLKVSDLYRRKFEFEKAREMIEAAIKLNPSDPTLKMKSGDLEIFKLEHNIRAFRKAAAAGKDPGGNAKADELEKQLNEFKLDEYEKRVNAHPTDTSFRFILGTLLFEKGEYDRSISEFQQARRDPQYRAQALVMLGRSFLKKDMVELAIKQFNEGLTNLEVMDDRRKELLYYLAEAQLAIGNDDIALNRFQEILEVDIRFKDVSDKVKMLRAKAKKAEQ